MDLSKMIMHAIEKREKNEHRNYIGCSSIGNPCQRSIWYAYHNSPCMATPALIQATFDVGRMLEGMILGYIEEAGFKLIRPSSENHFLYCFDSENPKFQGHMDAILIINEQPVVLEIKTAKDSRFNVFKSKGLKQFSPSYYSQIQAYIGMTGYKGGVLLAMNKDTSEFHHEWVEFDPYCYSELQAKAEAIESSDQPPEKINQSPLYFVCSKCKYKEICHFTEEKKNE